MSIFQIKDYIYICNNLVANAIITNGLGQINTFFNLSRRKMMNINLGGKTNSH